MHELLSGWDGPLGLALLAVVAFGDTLIGIGFFVFGEVAFLAAGAMVAAGGSLWPAIVVLVFAWAGDVTSYAIGARYGPRLTLPFLRHHKRRRAWRRARTELATRGAVFVVVARFLGPVAWVTPFLAGSLSMPWRVFLPASGLGGGPRCRAVSGLRGARRAGSGPCAALHGGSPRGHPAWPLHPALRALYLATERAVLFGEMPAGHGAGGLGLSRLQPSLLLRAEQPCGPAPAA